MENQNIETEIDLLELFHYLKKKILIILAVTIAFAGIGFFGTKLLIQPEYTASTRMYVLNRSSEINVVYSDFQTSTLLLRDYEVLITGRNVTEEVIDRLNLPMSPGTLASKISVSTPSGTRVLQISVTDSDPQRAADIANAVREIAAEQIQSIMVVDAVKDVYEAAVPGGPSGPDVSGNTITAALIGFAVSLIVFVVIFLLDDTIRTEEDVEHYLGLSVLGVIPSAEDIAVTVNKKAEKKHAAPMMMPGKQKK